MPREEIGAFLAAEKVLEKERLAMSAIWLATWDSALTKFQSEDETLEEVARREGWPSITPPLVFPE